MLREGHRLKKQGVDVVIGLVETHGRVGDRRTGRRTRDHPAAVVEYRGVTLREMDLDAILAPAADGLPGRRAGAHQRPGLAATPSGTRTSRTCSAGIHVITTVNIQHLESLYDEVERTTGVRVKERLPDRVLAEADQIVNVDVSAEDLLERLKAGKVYPAERSSAAMQNFFTPRI